jgi:SAM-dependent methyltransferase
MPSLEWLRKEFSYGYDSGNVLSVVPNLRRFREERAIGGSYRQVFLQAVLPYLKPDARVLELGPGRGSWSRAILKYIRMGELHTVDFQDVTPWLQPEKYGGRLICHQVTDNRFDFLPEDYFDFFWSFGVLCHNNLIDVETILRGVLPRMRPGGYAAHQYGDWEKLDKFGWERGRVPLEFKSQSDEEIWWPRNDRISMTRVASRAGWDVVVDDLGVVSRDGLIVLRRRAAR